MESIKVILWLEVTALEISLNPVQYGLHLHDCYSGHFVAVFPGTCDFDRLVNSGVKIDI